MIDLELKSRVAVVTGAPDARAHAVARALAAEGASVLLARAAAAARHSTDAELERILERGGLAAVEEADLADSRAPAGLFDHAEETFGLVSVLVHVVATPESDTLLPAELGARDALGRVLRRFDPGRHDRALALASRAPALLMVELARRYALRGASGGRVVLVAEEATMESPGALSRLVGAGALGALVRAGSAELARYGVTVNGVHVRAPSRARRLPTDDPFGRVADAEALADVVLFLASRQGAGVTGQVLRVGGRRDAE